MTIGRVRSRKNDGVASSAPLDPRRALPSPHVDFDKRILRQTYDYDWLGNTDKTTDDAGGFYDRSLGTVTNDGAANKPYQLKSATQSGARGGTVRAKYDDAGQMVRMDLGRSGPCLPTGATCSQRFAYEWDEVGRLGRARRWDTASGSSIDDPLPGGTPAADLRYIYDAGDQRVIKHAVDTSGESFTLYVFDSLEFKRSQFGTAYSDSGSGPADYEASVFTVVPYLLANGVRLARLAYEGMSEVPEVTPGTAAGQVNASVSQVHVFFELGDHLGSTSVVLDKATSELVERSTFQGYGATESDYRPGRWNAFREDYKFTGKEEDAEVGLTYFGKRYLNAYLGRWISADPLAIHAPGEADLNVYAYVSGSILKNVDPLGLEEEAPGAGGASDGGPSGAEGALSGPEPDEQSYLDACANGACVLAAPDQAVPPASPTPAPVSPSVPRLSQGPFAKARDQLIQQAQKADNGLEKATGYTLAVVMAGPASVEDGLRGVANAPSKAEEAGQHWARAAEFEAQCENGEALVEKLKAVESFADALSAGLGAASFATSRGGGWPADDGFLGPTRKKELAPGTLVDRYGGDDRSVFFAPAGTPLEARALRLEGRLEPLRTFEVIAPLQVRSGLSMPWFGQIGLGTQYRSNVRLKELINAQILREITK